MAFLLSIAFLWILSCDAASIHQAENIALRGRATQSSTLLQNMGFLGLAINAVDGNLNNIFNYGSCTSTQSQESPWWKVDLLKPYKISHIIITNRGDCCGEALNGALILVGNWNQNNGNNNPSCAQITSIQTGATQRYQCNDMVGRYVNIIIPGNNKYVQLCEVQVFGVPADGSCN